MIIVILLLGVVLGSFVNALVWRLHEQQKLAGKAGQAAAERRRRLSIVRGRSMCSTCGHELAAKDLVPVLSWLALRGKCRYCRAPIPDSPLVELATGLLFLWSYLAWPLGFQGVGLFQFVLWCVFAVGFVALAVYDLRWFLLPDWITLPLAGLAALQTVVAALWTREWSNLYEPLLAAVIVFGLFWGLYAASKGKWIGGGDVKLAVAIGLLAGTPLRACMLLFAASALGVAASVPLLLRGRSGLQARVPFGPYLLAATVLVVLYGPAVADWYERLLLG